MTSELLPSPRNACRIAIFLLFLATLHAQPTTIRLTHGADRIEIQSVAPNILRVHFEPGGKTTPRTLVMDPAFRPSATTGVRLQQNGKARTLTSSAMRVVVNDGAPFPIIVQDAAGSPLLQLRRDPATGDVLLRHDAREPLYGIHGLTLGDAGFGIRRDEGGIVEAGFQGYAGGPFLLTRRYAVLIDSDGGAFGTERDLVRFTKGSRPDEECFVMVGPPLATMSALSLLTGRPPMPPKWTLGFLNSQWGSTEAEWKQITGRYEKDNLPVSGYILDFDWKAWGEDNYGEWRWNSTSGPGNFDPDKFPDGASGKFAADMLQHGIHLAGILKPRILLQMPDGKPTEAAAYATAHHFWYPGEVRANDYFTHRPAANIDFSIPAARQWFWEHLIPAYRTGMSAWWNDEADKVSTTQFNNFQFLNMTRALYDGQRSISPERVWTINRNYYLGADRYGYAEWSGDIRTGYPNMEYQRRRMISTLDLGESEWSMDTGGYDGHPTNENYARWMEFGAFVPIFRVHGQLNEKRQPWVYGPVAEADARKVMRLRFDLLPYIYSYARLAYENGVGIVRPLFWEFPDDAKCAGQYDAWMFGDALLVSPIVESGAKLHAFYLPPGDWFDYATGKLVHGGGDVTVPIDNARWQDIPLYVRAGSILATQPQPSGNNVSPVTDLLLDVFPSPARAATFVVYDDDGHSYAYEKGAYFRQTVTATQPAGSTTVTLQPATGTYKSQIPDYVLRVHQSTPAVRSDGTQLRQSPSETAFRNSTQPAWFTTRDRFGAVTEVRLPVDGRQHTITLSAR